MSAGPPEFRTDVSLTHPALDASFNVFLLLTTGNVAGREAVTLDLPARAVVCLSIERQAPETSGLRCPDIRTLLRKFLVKSTVYGKPITDGARRIFRWGSYEQRLFCKNDRLHHGS